jgi:hypothetical protein
VSLAILKIRLAKSFSHEAISSPSLATVGAQSSIGLFPMFPNGRHFTSWNQHQIHLDRLPVLSKIRDSERTWISPLLGLSLSDRERVMRDTSETAIHSDLLMNLKESLTTIFLTSAGQSHHGLQRVFGLNDFESSVGVYAFIFVSDIRLDLAAQNLVADAWVLPLTNAIMETKGIRQGIPAIMESMVQLKTNTAEVQAWKRLLPVLIERCRTWKHKEDCAYLKTAPPLSLKRGESPICKCGMGVGAAAAFVKDPTWKPFAPYVTRAAISPLFALSFMEPIGGSLGASKGKSGSTPLAPQGKCAFCGKQKEKLLACGKCKKVKYCGADCQRKHWKTHKGQCSA